MRLIDCHYFLFDPTPIVAFIAQFAAIVFGMGWYPFCCCDAIEGECDCDFVTEQVQVDIAGMASGASCCSDFNGTYILDLDENFGGDAPLFANSSCRWLLTSDPCDSDPCCGEDFGGSEAVTSFVVQLTISEDTGWIIGLATARYASGNVYGVNWKNDYVGEQQCADWSDYELAPFSEFGLAAPGACDRSAATFHVTSL